MTCVSSRIVSRPVTGAFAAIASALGAVSAVAGDAGPADTTTGTIGYAIISPSRVMIGKNALVEGAVGTRYGIVSGELDGADADPLVMRGDFRGLDESLDASLDILYDRIVLHDVNGDNRLAVDHPVEAIGLVGAPGLVDYDGNRNVDDFDLFLAHFDVDGDGSVVYDTELAGGGAEEFSGIDDQLARLIDEALPDRNRDGVVSAADTARGYRDGVLDGRDRYAKVHGRLAFAVARSAWEDAHGASYQTVVRGPIRPGSASTTPVGFEVGADELPEITTAMLHTGSTWFHAEAQTGAPFGTYDAGSERWSGQVGAQLAADGEYEPPGPDTWESIPYGSPGAYDHYQRQVFRGMTFTNARIPKGTNALFESCTFIGVTWVETNEDCDDPNWNYAGAVEPIDDGGGGVVYELRFPELVAEYGDGIVVPDTRTESNNIRFHDCIFLGSVSGDTPIELTHWRNAVQFTGATGFHLDAGDPVPAASADAAESADLLGIRSILSALDPADRAELATSSLFLPGWSVSFSDLDFGRSGGPGGTPPTTLRGIVVAGLLDARGTMDIHGTIVLTFRPVEGKGPLFYGGHPAGFRTTIGFLGPEDGAGAAPDQPGSSGFGAITVRCDPDVRLPAGIPWQLYLGPAARVRQ